MTPFAATAAVMDFMEMLEMTRSSAATGMILSMDLPEQITFTGKPETIKSSATQAMTSFTLATEMTTFLATTALTSSKVKPVQTTFLVRMGTTTSRGEKVTTISSAELEKTSSLEVTERMIFMATKTSTNYMVKPVRTRSSGTTATI